MEWLPRTRSEGNYCCPLPSLEYGLLDASGPHSPRWPLLSPAGGGELRLPQRRPCLPRAWHPFPRLGYLSLSCPQNRGHETSIPEKEFQMYQSRYPMLWRAPHALSSGGSRERRETHGERELACKHHVSNMVPQAGERSQASEWCVHSTNYCRSKLFVAVV